jgi:hypothetical protein
MQTSIKDNKTTLQNLTTNRNRETILRLEKIEARVHELYLARGAETGHELDDWLQAEREIMGWV